jgi:hypothetical protein
MQAFASECKYLTDRYARPDQIAEVSEDNELTSDKELVRTFNILAYDLDLVTTNGKKYRVAPVTIAVRKQAPISSFFWDCPSPVPTKISIRAQPGLESLP